MTFAESGCSDNHTEAWVGNPSNKLMGRDYANIMAGRALWRADDVEESGDEPDRHSRDHARHQRQHDDLQQRRCDDVAAVYIPESVAFGSPLREQPEDRDDARVDLAGQYRRTADKCADAAGSG